MAAYGAKLAVQNALNGDARGHLYQSTGRYGRFDEKKAREQGKDVKTSVLGLEHVPRALATRDTRGLIKLVAGKTTDRLLGAHMIAPEAGDSIQTAAIAIKSESKLTPPLNYRALKGLRMRRPTCLIDIVPVRFRVKLYARHTQFIHDIRSNLRCRPMTTINCKRNT